MIEVIRRGNSHVDKISILSDGRRYAYRELLDASESVSCFLLSNKPDLQEDRVAFMIAPGFNYVCSLWGIWQAGGVAVPLCLSHPAPSIQFVLKDTGCSVVIASKQYTTILSPLCKEMGIQLIPIESIKDIRKVQLPDISETRRAMILYTSGTTNQPKGVVTTHKNLRAQITMLVKAWKWNDRDHTLCVLPLHHVHGIVNVVSCSLWAGACCEFLPEFDTDQVFKVFLERRVNVFMAVPTIYFKLIARWEQYNTEQQEQIALVLRSFRLMVSGSAALPVSVMEKWEAISGHKLLERYGMTELGMAISNPYTGWRQAGKVGLALEGVSIRLCDDSDKVVDNEPGEIQVRGDSVFLEYWKQPEATRLAFTADGWFKTGDVAVREEGYYRILGRNSIDIIKSGGFKISALEIEEVLRTHPSIRDCAVVGLENEEWGEVVAAALVPSLEDLKLEELQKWLKEQIPPYRLPRKFLVVSELPRNAMGKVMKNEVKKLF